LAHPSQKGLIKETVITYPESIMRQLKEYIGNRKGLVFITRGEKPVLLTQIADYLCQGRGEGWN